MEKTKRSLKTTRAQYQLYLDQLRQNEIWKNNKFDASKPNIIEETWMELTVKLNAVGGPSRDVAGWKRIFTDWKSQTRAKARKLKCALKETGNVGEPPKPLNDLEEALLDITGKVVVEGIKNVPEFGIEEAVSLLGELEQENASTEVELSKCGDTKKAALQENEKNKCEPPKKKRKTLTSSVNEIMNTFGADNTIFQDLCVQLKKLRKNAEKKLKLKQMELQVKYPDYTFVLSDYDSD